MSMQRSAGSHGDGGVDDGNSYHAPCFHFPSHLMLFQVCDVVAMAAHDLLPPPGV